MSAALLRPSLRPLRTRRRAVAPARTRPRPPAARGAMRHELWGPDGAPVVVVLGGISAGRHVAAHTADPTPGWWDGVVGPGLGIDTRHVRVLGVDYLDGGRGADGRPARTVTTRDQADAIVALLDRHGVGRAHAVVGASYGGMVALALAAAHPERVERLVVIGAAHVSHPMSTALRLLQRQVVELGIETGQARRALSLARGVAMTTYRTPGEFDARFGGRADARDGLDAVGGYLAHCGARYAAACAPERFLALSHSADLHQVDPAAVRTPALLVAVEGDALVPEGHVRELAAKLGTAPRLEVLATRSGHDGFLTEQARVGALVAAALDADGGLLPNAGAPAGVAA